ncbi:MAG: response regulator [Candidatus Omnitrophota bacterium]|jgi:two-component system alkaline phosphatase synthesis response regulator PhoP|nr:MAG: response regulator [Candidatus Omnitrophota bacterium]
MITTFEKTVLVVDDEENLRLYLQTVLEDAGFSVVTAVDGLDALEKVKANPPDAISLDLVMPKKSGFKFLNELRKHKEWHKIPVILVTAHAQDDLGKEDFDNILSNRLISGPETYLEKPVKPENYVNSIKRVLGLEEGEPPHADDARTEIESLLDKADPGKMEQILKILKESK